MGYTATDVNALSILTSKRPKGALTGNRVWLLTGEGTPRTFYLRGTFLVSDVEDSGAPDFGTVILGKDGAMFSSMFVLNHELWFPGFRRNQGNFAFGFQSINDPMALAGLHALRARHGCN